MYHNNRTLATWCIQHRVWFIPVLVLRLFALFLSNLSWCFRFHCVVILANICGRVFAGDSCLFNAAPKDIFGCVFPCFSWLFDCSLLFSCVFFAVLLVRLETFSGSVLDSQPFLVCWWALLVLVDGVVRSIPAANREGARCWASFSAHAYCEVLFRQMAPPWLSSRRAAIIPDV